MVAVEFASPSHSTLDPATNASTPKNFSSRVSKRCLEKGMLLLITSAYETVRLVAEAAVSW